FESIWSRGLPLIVRGAPGHGLLYDWSPTSLSSILPDEACDVVNCETDDVTRTTIKTFLQNLEESKAFDGSFSSLKLKVTPTYAFIRIWGHFLAMQDYPQDMLFKNKSTLLARDFKSALPVQMYTDEDGPLNLAAMYPLEYECKPDIGPKIYATTASGHNGSTHLHMDMTDAINIMASGRALWHIFRSDDADAIRQVLKPYCDPTDPINSHQI
ncbi:hypothetical protein PLEOSDRAFT_1023267, partial [Pleurotus ostreatus PC15]